MADYVRGDSTNIIVGAAAVFLGQPDSAMPAPVASESYAETMSDPAQVTAGWANVGYTSNGLELTFAPEFGEVQVDQILDVAKLYKSGMTVTLNTGFAEATLDNLAIAIAHSAPGTDLAVEDLDGPVAATDWVGDVLNVASGNLNECPVERKLVAVGPGGGDCDPVSPKERVYTAFRVLSIDSVSASAKRDEASVYDVSFRLLPNSFGLYGQIVDRTYTPV